jgi:hypothetical protein
MNLEACSSATLGLILRKKSGAAVSLSFGMSEVDNR